ncbi:MAG: GNAT family N-acetyltransferase [Clostridiales bacterium]|nr:GNAT family N-acetyltransferase [Clostridiales bacterium]
MKTHFTIQLRSSNREFEKCYARILSDKELQLNLFLRNLDGSDKPLPPQNIRGIVINEKCRIELLFLNAYPFNLQLAGLSRGSTCATAYLAKYIVENDIAIRGVQGEYEVCSAFANEYEKLTGKKMQPHFGMDILRLAKLNAVEVSGKLRPVIENDQFVVDWIAAMQAEAVHEQIDRETALEKFKTMVAERNLFVYENENGTPTSIVQAKPHGRYATLSYVYTRPEYRNRGYGKAMVHELCKMLAGEYKGFVLFVDKTNPSANKIYSAVGFERVCENYDFRIVE